MRLFVAIDAPQGFDDYFFSMQKQLLFGNGIFSRAKHFHCTIKFLGEVKEELVPKIVEQLKKVRFETFETTLSRPGVFPDDKQPKVLWLGFDKTEKLLQLQKKIEEALAEFHIENSYEEFTPHVTIARITKIRDKNHFREKLTRYEKHRFKVNKFILYQSELLHTGPKYTKIAEFQALGL